MAESTVVEGPTLDSRPALPLSTSAWYESPGTPPWGPKIWLTNCNDRPDIHPAIFCWN